MDDLRLAGRRKGGGGGGFLFRGMFGSGVLARGDGGADVCD